jgi:hypothetical protein
MSNFQRFILQTGTALHQTDVTFDFAVADWNKDHWLDILAIKKSNTDTHGTEVHILDGMSNFQRFILQTGTAIHPTDVTFDFAVADWNNDPLLDLLAIKDLIAIKKSNTDTRSTEVHILEGLSPLLPPQTWQVSKDICIGGTIANDLKCLGNSRQIDFLIISGGGNDIGFSDIIKGCIEMFLPPCHKNNTIKNNLNSAFSSLPDKYDHLASDINRRMKASNVMITEYPDPTHDRHGNYCDRILGIAPFGIDKNELKWASENILKRLNQELYNAAARNDWIYIGDIASQFKTHGYCAEAQSWIRNLDESLLIQGDIYGTMHPNLFGQSIYKDRLIQEIGQTLFRYEGVITGYVYPNQSHGAIPLYHYFKESNGDHLYTVERNDDGNAEIGYAFRGIAAYIYPQYQPGTVALNSYFKDANGDHFIGTTNDTTAMSAIGYTKEHIIGYVHPNQTPGSIPLYSYYNDATGHHFYTVTRAEME